MNEAQTRPDWTEYFLDIARAVGRRSTCLRRKYGAIIVKDKIIISTGYNGAPRGEANCNDTGVCERERLHVPKGQNHMGQRSFSSRQLAPRAAWFHNVCQHP